MIFARVDHERSKVYEFRSTSLQRDSAESAFAALVERHGPMVYRVCRTVLGDEHDAQDAFQATFLILSRRARSLWVRDSLGPWLYGVAYRTSSCARSASARRRTHERKAAEALPRVVEPSGWDDLGPVVHEEVQRLPARIRSAVVLCYLEGLTHEQAAEQLRCPVGTIRSRLAAGRQRLRGRLLRRGLASSDELLAGSHSFASSDTSFPATLAAAAVRNASAFAASSGFAIIPASVVALTERGLRLMCISQMRILSVALLVIGGASIGVFALAQGGPGVQSPATPSDTLHGSPGPSKPARQTQDSPARTAAQEETRKTLIKARIETARQILESETRLRRGGELGLATGPDLVPPADGRSTTPGRNAAERIAAIREHRSRMISSEQILARNFEEGRSPQADVLKGRYYRLEADELLAEKGSIPSKEVVPTGPKPDSIVPGSSPAPGSCLLAIAAEHVSLRPVFGAPWLGPETGSNRGTRIAQVEPIIPQSPARFPTSSRQAACMARGRAHE